MSAGDVECQLDCMKDVKGCENVKQGSNWGRLGLKDMSIQSIAVEVLWQIMWWFGFCVTTCVTVWLSVTGLWWRASCDGLCTSSHPPGRPRSHTIVRQAQTPDTLLQIQSSATIANAKYIWLLSKHNVPNIIVGPKYTKDAPTLAAWDTRRV